MVAVAALLALCHIAAAGQSDRELCAAARDGDRAESQRLLDTGYADANTANTRRCACNTKQYSRSPVLSIAAQGGHTEVVALLIERGADVAATDRRGELVAGRRHVIISSSSSSASRIRAAQPRSSSGRSRSGGDGSTVTAAGGRIARILHGKYRIHHS